MAAATLSPQPPTLSSAYTMSLSTRRAPLTANPNVANSPLRGAAAGISGLKSKRSYASTQREDLYGQPPPAKRQMVDNGVSRTTIMKPSVKQRPVASTRAVSRVTSTQSSIRAPPYEPSAQEVEEVRKWQVNQRKRFPENVFYFDSIHEEHRAKLARQIAHLGAREDKFFSNNVTHVVTTRSIPAAGKAARKEENTEPVDSEHENAKTINPSLLSRTTENLGRVALKRKLFENQSQDTKILQNAQNMGKKIWPLSKLQHVVEMLLEPDPARSAAIGASRATSHTSQINSAHRAAEGADLLQMINQERITGPSDRDLTVASRELVYFKGPYIYIYDMEEKQKPIMARDYPKVVDKEKGEWPQFRAAGNGRCPFVEDPDPDRRERRAAKEAKDSAAKAAVNRIPKLQPPAPPAPKPVTSKRTLATTDDGHNRGKGVDRAPEPLFNPSKDSQSLSKFDFQPQNAFVSKAKEARLFGGEPVASGIQPSGITSAIRSQMISSATGALGSKAGTSKEIHSLQRKVLQGSVGQETLTRHRSDAHATFEVPAIKQHKRAVTIPNVPRQKKRDLKPGYCENCQDKYNDFDEHIESRKHRRFAEDDNNWTELDELLKRLERGPRISYEWTGSDC